MLGYSPLPYIQVSLKKTNKAQVFLTDHIGVYVKRPKQAAVCLWRSDLQLQDPRVGGGSADLLNDSSVKRTFACRGDIAEGGGQSLLLPPYLLCDEPRTGQ